MIDFQIQRGPSSLIFSEPGIPNPRLIIEEGCWYLCTDTAELYLGVKENDKLTLKQINGSHNNNAADHPSQSPDSGDSGGSNEAARSIIGAYIKEESGELYLLFSDNTEESVGKVVGKDGADGTDGLVTTIKIGEKFYNHINGVIELPEAPTKVSDFENDANYATQQFVTESIATINPQVEEVKTKLETEVLPTVQDTILPAVQKVETEILPAIQELAEKAATQHWVQEQKYLTNEDAKDFASTDYVDAKFKSIEIPEVNLEDYAKKDELFSKSYNDLTDKPEIPSVEGLATEDFVRAEIEKIDVPTIDTDDYITTETLNSALVAKANEVPFSIDQFVTKPIGDFKAGDSVKGLTVAQLFAKLLGLSDEPVENPDTPQNITIELVKQNSIPVMQGGVSSSDGSIAVEDSNSTFMHIELAESDKTKAPQAADPGTSALYEIKNDAGEVIEHGYQIYTIASGRGTYWRVALAEGLTLKEVQMYDDLTASWVPYTPTFADTGERLESNGYTYVVYQSSDRSNKEILRLVIE